MYLPDNASRALVSSSPAAVISSCIVLKRKSSSFAPSSCSQSHASSPATGTSSDILLLSSAISESVRVRRSDNSLPFSAKRPCLLHCRLPRLRRLPLREEGLFSALPQPRRPRQQHKYSGRHIFCVPQFQSFGQNKQGIFQKRLQPAGCFCPLRLQIVRPAAVFRAAFSVCIICH